VVDGKAMRYYDKYALNFENLKTTTAINFLNSLISPGTAQTNNEELKKSVAVQSKARSALSESFKGASFQYPHIYKGVVLPPPDWDSLMGTYMTCE